MSKSIKQLHHDLTVLTDKIQDLANNLQTLYQDYFQHLKIVVKRQLVLATYQVCTQKYPEEFLKLTYQERYDLQEKIKDLDNIFQEDLSKGFKSIKVNNNPVIKNFYNKIISIFSNLKESENNNDLSTENQDKLSDEINKEEELKPQDLIRIQVEMENCLEESLTTISHRANKYLQEVNILPKKIPNKILEMALQSEENTSLISGIPNLLSLIIERDDKSENIDVTPIFAISLKLTEIEFNDTNLNSLRQKINHLLRELNILDDKYQNTKQKYLILQAESAWRSSWVDN